MNTLDVDLIHLDSGGYKVTQDLTRLHNRSVGYFVEEQMSSERIFPISVISRLFR